MMAVQKINIGGDWPLDRILYVIRSAEDIAFVRDHIQRKYEEYAHFHWFIKESTSYPALLEVEYSEHAVGYVGEWYTLEVLERMIDALRAAVDSQAR